MRATYKTVKGPASVDFAKMARQLADELKVDMHNYSLSMITAHAALAAAALLAGSPRHSRYSQ